MQITHSTNVTLPNNPTDQVSANAWNAAHTITASASTLLGNPTGSSGVVGEITLGAGLSFSGSTLVASGSSPTFDQIGSGDNTTATMTVDTGASLSATGSGVIAATSAPASGITGTTLASNVVTSSLTTVGTIGTGTWAGTAVAVSHGGTGQITYTNGQLLIGNTTGNTLTKATLTQGTGISITNGTGSITIATTGVATLAGGAAANTPQIFSGWDKFNNVIVAPGLAFSVGNQDEYIGASSAGNVTIGDVSGNLNGIIIAVSTTNGITTQYGSVNINTLMDVNGTGNMIAKGSMTAASLIIGSTTENFPASGNIVGTTDTQTLTNKRVTKRVVTPADATSITPNTDNADITYQSNSQAIGTLTINADTGTPTNGQSWLLKIKSTNVQTFSWTGGYVGGTNTLPIQTTGGGKIDNYAFLYDTVNSVWEFTGAATGF